tara:strand:- start:1717 stop:2112 length:396 start_codon:yes stop_codon:yes gene_type:complete
MNKRSHIIIYNENYGYLLMLKYKLEKGVYHQLLSGGVENGETHEETIIREIKEEINLDIESQRIRTIYSGLNRKYYFIKIQDSEANQIKISSEHIGYTFIKKQHFLPKIIIKQAKGEVSKTVQDLIDKNII